MILKGILAVRHWQAQNKQANLDEWYLRNKWAGNARAHNEAVRAHDSERDFVDEDFPGRGLEFEFWEIPN